jgi:hypothetical protein
MEDKHELHISYDEEKGTIIQDLKCPFREKIEDIKTWYNKLRKLPRNNLPAQMLDSNWEDFLKIMVGT